MKKERDNIRQLQFEIGFIKTNPYSCLVSMGDTKALCAVSVEDAVPEFLSGKGTGWLTAEYRMLPCSTVRRIPRDRSASSGRTFEIQRLIGRALRAAVDLANIGERTLHIDVDVLQADGGTRTAGINGAMVALGLCLKDIAGREGMPLENLLKGIVSAVSVGIVDGEYVLDLAYEDDSRAEVDMNIVMIDAKRFIEVQGTAERGDFGREELNTLLSLAEKGIKQICDLQKKTLF